MIVSPNARVTVASGSFNLSRLTTYVPVLKIERSLSTTKKVPLLFTRRLTKPWPVSGPWPMARSAPSALKTSTEFSELIRTTSPAWAASRLSQMTI